MPRGPHRTGTLWWESAGTACRCPPRHLWRPRPWRRRRSLWRGRTHVQLPRCGRGCVGRQRAQKHLSKRCCQNGECLRIVLNGASLLLVYVSPSARTGHHPMTSTIAAGRPAGTARRSDKSRGRAGSIGLWLVMLAQLMLVLDATVVNVALPHIATDLHFTRAQLSWVLNGYAVAFGGLLLLGGRIGDVFGRRRTFLVGVAVFTVFSLLGGLATSPLLLVIARALQGLGAAFAAPSVLALITTSARDDGARNRALALFSAVASMGGALGLILGGLLTDMANWRWTLFINVPIGVVVLIAVPRLVAETPRRPGRFDILGAVTATGGAVAIVWALIQAADDGWSSPRTIGGFVAGAALITVLAFTERRVAHPLLRPQLLRSPSRVAALAAMAATYGGMLAMFFLMVQYLANDLHLTPLLTGLAFLPMPLSIFAMSRIVPRLVERFGAVRLVIF